MSAHDRHKSWFWNLSLGSYVQGWMLSLLLHGTALGASLVVLGDLKLAPEPEPFKWEVSLVETSQPVAEQPAMTQPAPEPVKPKPVQKPAPAKPPVEPKIVEPIKKVEPPPQVVQEPPPPEPERKREEEKPVETIHEATTAIPRAAEPVEPPQPKMPEPVAKAETKIETKEVARADTAPPLQTAPAPPEPRVEPPAAKDSAPAPPQPIQEATLRPQPAAPPQGKRTDFGWLANALWERVSHLQKYPHLARLKHVEGRVVLRAVITASGHLASAVVAKSSGSELLDEDALATLHKACPLYLAQPLGRQEVVVMIPINYRLN